jgi:hypothetical protein
MGDEAEVIDAARDSPCERQSRAGGAGPRHAPEELLKDAIGDSGQLLGEVADDATACGTEGALSSKPSSPGTLSPGRLSGTLSPGRLDVEGIVAEAAGRPDFTGSWQCVRVDGDVYGFLQDMGLSPIMCEAARSAHYGAGHQLQIITQEGDHFTVVDQLKTTVTMKCQVGVGPQASCDLEGKPVTVTPTWDGQTLCVETMTGSGELFATSRRFLEGDEMLLELTSPAGATMRRIFCKKDSTKNIRSTCSTRLTIATVTSSV